MRVCDEFDPQAVLPDTPLFDGLLDMKHLAQIRKIIQPGAYAYRALMVEVYKAYQGSPDWKSLVERVKRRDGYCCWRCHVEIVKHGVIHHLSYDNWGKVDKLEENDCVFVCRGCHNHLHRTCDVEVPFWAMRNPEGVYPPGASLLMSMGYAPVLEREVVEQPVLVVPKGHKRCNKCHDYYPKDFGGKIKGGYWVCSNCQHGLGSPNRSGRPVIYTVQDSIGSFNQGATL